MRRNQDIAEQHVDLVVIGAGGAGLTAALVASIMNLKVIVVEKIAQVGGTTALSAGSIWLPNSHHAADKADSFDNVMRYLNATVGNYAPESLRRAFLTHSPAMLRLLEDNSSVKLRAYAYHPDYLADLPGATTAGRVLEPIPFDGRLLGQHFKMLQAPLPEFTLFGASGGMMVDRTDIGHLLNSKRSLRSLRHSSRLLTRYAFDRLRYPRGTRLVMGNALVGRLLYSLLQRKVPIWTNCAVSQLLQEDNHINGIAVTHTDKQQTTHLIAHHGVVLASGGFSHHPLLREQLLLQPTAAYSVVPASNRGEGIDFALAKGAQLATEHANNSFWAPVSVRQRRDGSSAVFPHFVLDRGKPGLIAVNAAGKRFVNESTTYQLFTEAIYASHKHCPTIPCFFICDHVFIQKYGLGMVRPGGLGLKKLSQQKYLISAHSLHQLAQLLAIDPAGLAESVARNNQFAEIGLDNDFAKGSNAYQLNLGDPDHQPNPCLGPIKTPPFYAIKIYPGDIGTSCGLITNESAQVLNKEGNPIAGLYACGNDMASIMGGIYPAPGITLGPAMTFAYLAVQHAAKRMKA